MRTIISFFIYTNIFVSISALSLYKITELIFDFRNNIIGCFVFFATLFAYNYMRLPFFFAEENRPRNFWIEKNIHIIYLILVISFFSICYCVSVLGVIFLYLTVPIILISCMYPIRIDYVNKLYALREIPLLKIFLIATSWSSMTVLIPLLYLGYTIDYYLISHLLRIFLFIIAISIPFDIRDLHLDKVNTIPKYIGVLNAKIFSFFCLFIFELLLIFDLLNALIPVPIFLSLFISIELSALIIYSSNEKRSEWFYSILVESLSIIMCLFVLVMSMI